MSYILSYEPTNPLEVTNALFFYPSINRFADEKRQCFWMICTAISKYGSARFVGKRARNRVI